MQDVTSLAHSDSPFSTFVALVCIYRGRLQKICPFFSIGVKAVSFFEEETRRNEGKISSVLYNRPWKPRGGVEIQLYSFFNLGARWSWVINARPGRFTPANESPYSLHKRLGGPQGQAGCRNSILGPSSRREPQYWLLYSDPNILHTSILTNWSGKYDSQTQ
jgi:hypothetical protein